VWIEPHLTRRSLGVVHPVEDFMFTYYNLRPARLLKWHPGAEVVLAGASGYGAAYRDTAEGAVVDHETLLRQRRAFLDWTHALLAATVDRQPHFGCFGMHEWAMVYRTRSDEIRHSTSPLRLTAAEIEMVVEEREVRCTHFDAFRFFTPAARTLNAVEPTRERQHTLEQSGCLHANMDLYKWAYKLSPLISSDLVADCFELARDIRAIDMRASPYDLTADGYVPIKVETPEGRAEYAAAQREFSLRSAPLRRRLLDECIRLEEIATRCAA